MTTTGTYAGERDLAKAILDLEGKRIAAMVNRDLDTLDALLADDLSYTHSGGVTETKAIFLKLIRDRDEKHNYLGVDYANAEVIPMPGGAGAVVRGRAAIRLEGIPAYSVLFLNVWALRDGAWKMLAWQATRVP
jgi:hypothetical protein